MSIKKFDICFFTKGIPPKLVLSSGRWAFARVDGSGLAIVAALAEGNPRFQLFMKGNSETLRAFVYRGEGDEYKSVIRDAFSQLEMLLDTYALMTDNPTEVAKTIIVRATDNKDAEYFEYYKDESRFIQRIDAKGELQWHSRNYTLFQVLSKYLTFTSTMPFSDTNEVEQYLRFALRMYRLGFEASFPGLSFLAKFSGLECLVLGSDKSRNKGDMLVERLGNLFDELTIATPENVRKLWKLRCDASHQARLAISSSLNHFPAEIASIYIDQLFSGVIYFIVDKFDGQSTLDDIWASAEDYTLPEIITLHRPPDMGQLPVAELLVGPKGSIPNAGQIFDQIHSALSNI
jgi:hypothetical protein